jgi:hypothetical protein
MSQSVMEILIRVWDAFQAKILGAAPRALAAVVVLGCGWLTAALVRGLLVRALKLARFDPRCERSGFDRLLRRCEFPWTPTEVMGKVTFWGIWACGAVLSLSALEVPALDRLVMEFFLYLPRIIVAGAILALGFLLAGFLSRAALLLAVNEELPTPRLVAACARLFVHLLAVAMAMEQLGIASGTVTLAFAITFGAFMLALALAFGLGGREPAARFLAERSRREEKEDGRRHL